MISEIHMPTIGTNSGVISVPNLVSRPILKYRATLTQTEVDPFQQDPVVTLFFEDDTNLNPAFNYDDVGRYTVDKIGGFPEDSSYAWFGSPVKTGIKIAVKRISDDQLQIKTNIIDGVSAPASADNLLNNDMLNIDFYGAEVPTTSEETFDYLLTQMDANQLELWKKIVVRFGGETIEVDGDKYRKTEDFDYSSISIQS